MNLEIDGRTVKLPDFLIVGAARSGTTSLFKYLNEHPRIFIPEMKESYFLAYDGKVTEFAHHKMPVVSDFNGYARLFEPAGEDQILGEVSASYLYLHETTIPNIKKYIPDWRSLKIIMILREPVERAFSMHSAFVTWDEEPLKFEDALKKCRERLKNNWHPEFDYIGYGFYYEQVKAYLDSFPHVKVYLYEDLKKDTKGLIKDIIGFLGVEDSDVPYTHEKHNPSRVPKSKFMHDSLHKPSLISSVFPPVKLIPLDTRIEITRKLIDLNIMRKLKMRKNTQQQLKKLYREDILKLQELIGRDLSGWLE